MSGMTFEPLDDVCFGARVSGVKLAEMDQASFDELYDRWLEYGLLIVGG